MTNLSHYFTENHGLQPNLRTFKYSFGGGEYVFTTDSGVFSTGHIDRNTDILIKSIPPLEGSLLDLGCGYGCIGIVLAKEYNLSLVQTDSNPEAIKLASYNAKQNKVKTNVFVSDGFSQINGLFNTIVLNPPIHAGKGVVYRLYEGAACHLAENGEFYIVILKKHGAPSTLKKLKGLFGTVDYIYKRNGCYVLCCVSPI